MSLLSLIYVLRYPAILLLSSAFFIQCSSKKVYHEYIIRGNLEHLPAGSIVLETPFSEERETLDSIVVVDGKFEFRIPVARYPESIRVAISHYDTNQVKRSIFFLTGTKGKAGYGGIESSSEFMLEDGIELKGTLKLHIAGEWSSFHSQQIIQVGRQTRVMYDDTAGFQVINNLNTLKNLVRQHPYSYYYLDVLKRRAPRAANAQFYALFNLLNSDVRESSSGRQLKHYFDTRDRHKLTWETSLPDSNGVNQPILSKDAGLTMVVLWASWCGPCRAEIPQLKKIYSEYADREGLHMVTISFDNRKKDWEKALRTEKMPWKQLMITPETLTYAREIFGFDQRVPLTLLVNSEGEIVRSFKGYGEKSAEQFEELIVKHTRKPRGTL
ncbi:thioredoxin-like domain-containing protein [Salmonirosea aquatica]|uniref:Redoxin domain-containing protein n=1 Tax=Salmonirosea aquatica TaxID=2654236 RepID=A0A7C9F209_9BACT|nr:redoxin domain-containing protein [Cytophagaceae bacterium SJW1-29]